MRRHRGGYKHNDLKAGEREFAIASIFRGWTYRAFVDRKTGKLHRVTAGCRCWPDFETAHAHYRGEGAKRDWSNQYINELLIQSFTGPDGTNNVLRTFRPSSSNFSFLNNGGPLNAFMNRAEARAILIELRKRVHANQDKVRRVMLRRRREKANATRARNRRAA